MTDPGIPQEDESAASPTPFLERMGRYVLLERIAQGGMAEVFRAAAVGSAGFSKMLAIKRVLPDLAKDQPFITMFVDEARIASLLSHPNILQVLDLGSHQGRYFIVMEYVAGASLNRVMAAAIRAGRRIPLEMTCHVVGCALEGLAYAHRKKDAYGTPLGIIHRDVSPHNIMLSFDGAVKLADFGIAKAAVRLTQGTATGAVKGKPGYLAPEQLDEELGPSDQRLDLYAMGVVLHEMLSHRRMRAGKDDMQVLAAAVAGKVPPLGDAVPGPLAEVVYKALQARPQDRFQTAPEFQLALQQATRALGQTWTSVRTAEVLGPLLRPDLQMEESAERRYSTLITRLAEQGTDELTGVDALLHEHVERHPSAALPAPPPLGPPPMTTQAVARHAKRPLWPWAAVVAALLGVGAWWLYPRPGTLTVESIPAGARVKVSGRFMDGVTPLTLPGIPPGVVPLEMELAGHAPWSGQVTVEAGGQARARAELVAQVRKVRMTSVPPGATVFLDDKELGVTPLEVAVPAGLCVVRLTAPQHVPVQRTLEPGPLPPVLDLTLAPEPTVEAPARVAAGKVPTTGGAGKTGLVSLQSQPWARVFIDGKDTGQFTPVFNLELPVGAHVVRLVNAKEQLSSQVTVRVKAGSRQVVTRQLQ